MLKSRVSVPRSVKESVLKEFNHRCAVCAAEKPHLHHIDENRANNDASNLLPLCQNSHLIDPHDPTKPLEAGKLRLLRHYRDPSILKPQFHPIYRRLKFLDDIAENARVESLNETVEEAVNFLVSFEMGVYYGGRVHELLQPPPCAYNFTARSGVTELMRQAEIQQDQDYREQLRSAREEVFCLVIEMLRFQKW
jgi:hypothetical protein